jgi:hypothetical protein
MSFGVSVGDFLAVGRLVLDLYNACKDAPGEFQEICRELSSIHTVLSGLAIQAQDPNSLLIKQGKERIPEWTKIQENLEFTLGELQDLVKRYYKMGRNAWLRIQFVSENLANLKGRLSFHLNVINTFVSSLSLSALGRMEPALGRIELLLRESVREERKGNKEPTVLSAYENNDKVSWEKIEMGLAVEGVSKQEFEKNKERIRELLEWVVDHGADLAALEEVGIGDSVSQTGPGEGNEQTQQSGEMAPSGKHKTPTANQLEIIETWSKKARPRRGARGMLATVADPKKKQTQESGLWKVTGRLFSGSKPGERKYTYRAKAIESYEAQRPNELSYTKDETLEVAPSSGGWWPARDGDGKRGIISSDSFVLNSEIVWENTPTPTLFSRLWSNLNNEDDADLLPVFYYGETCARAWAREMYVASLWCTNDLSFQKHELLELSAYGGLWWMACNKNGEIGVVPADHLAILWSKWGHSNLSLRGKDQKGNLVREEVSIEALRKNENGVFDKYLSPEAIMKNWG